MMKKTIFAVIIVMFLAIGCSSMTEEISENEMTVAMEEEMAEKEMEIIQEAVEDVDMPAEWKDIELKDVSTGEIFKINDFPGKTILIESFAVWCPTCRKQQDEMKKLHDLVGDDVVSISLDTDPNEDESKVLSHVNRYGYDWRYAVAPVELTKALIDKFGINIVNAPGAPVVMICSDGMSRLLPRGVKDADELNEEIKEGC